MLWEFLKKGLMCFTKALIVLTSQELSEPFKKFFTLF